MSKAEKMGDDYQKGSQLAKEDPVDRETTVPGASEELNYVVKRSIIATVIVSGVALFSDGFTAQIGSWAASNAPPRRLLIPW